MARMSTSGVRAGSPHTKRSPSAKRSASKAAAKAAAPSSVIIILLERRDVRELDQMAAVAEEEPVDGEAELARLVPAEHLDRDREAHVVAHHRGPADAERARQLARPPSLVEERVGRARRLVGEAEAQLVEGGHAEMRAEQRQRGREVVAVDGKPCTRSRSGPSPSCATNSR